MKHDCPGETWVRIRIFAELHIDDDIAFAGHFDGKVDEVAEGLENARAVAHNDGGEIGCGLADEFNAFVFRGDGETAHSVIQAVDQVEGKNLELEFARLEFGKFVKIAGKLEP